MGTVAARRKAVLKHTQSKRWRAERCGPANAKRLDCARFIAAFSGHAFTQSAARIRPGCLPSSVFGFNPNSEAGQRVAATPSSPVAAAGMGRSEKCDEGVATPLG